MSSSWRFHCHIQSLEAFVISNNPNISNPLKIIWVGKEKKLIETCTWKQRRAVGILNFRLYNSWGAPTEGGGVLRPLHMQTKLHMNISLTWQYVTHFHNAVSFKSTSSDKNIPQFLGVFRDFFFTRKTSTGSQNSAYCTKQRWHLFSKDKNNPWIEVIREDVPAF